MESDAFHESQIVTVEGVIVLAFCHRKSALVNETINRRWQMLQSVLRSLDAQGISWCLLHHGSALPGALMSDMNVDVDMVVSGAAIRDIIGTLKHLEGMYLCQVLRYRPHAYYCVFATREGGDFVPLAIDMACDLRDAGCLLYTGTQIIETRRAADNGLWIPAPEIEFTAYLCKRILKSRRLGAMALTDDVGTHLSQLFRGCEEAVATHLGAHLSPSSLAVICRAAAANEWEAARRHMDRLRADLVGTHRFRHIGIKAFFVAEELNRIVWRCRRPTGLMVAVLGVEGADNPHVLDGLEYSLRPYFRRTARFEFRPKLLPAHAHGPYDQNTPHGRFTSLAKLAYLWIDYVAGYVLRLWPAQAATTLVLFDRYFDDLHINPVRYYCHKIGGVASALRRFIPQPHLIIILDARAAANAARVQQKSELPGDGIHGLRRKYLGFAQRTPGCVVVNAEQPLPKVIADVTNLVADQLARRIDRYV